MASKHDCKAAQERILSRPRLDSRSEQETLRKTADDGVAPSPLNIKRIALRRLSLPADRQAAPADSLDELAQSLRLHGQLAPILVEYHSEDDAFVIVDGARRWRAAQLAGVPALDAVIIDRLSEGDRLERRLVEMVHPAGSARCDLAAALQAYKDERGLATWPEVAAALGMTEASLARLMATKRPAPIVQTLLREERLSEKEAQAFRGLAQWRQEALAAAMTAGGVEGAFAARAARLMKADGALQAADAIQQAQVAPAAPAAAATPLEAIGQVNAAVEALERALGRLKPGKAAGGEIIPLLGQLDRSLDEHRARLQQPRPAPAEESGRAVKGMPAWGLQR